MIENEELGLKIADNAEEAYWIKIKEEANKRTEAMKREIVINEAVIELAERKIKQNKEET